MNLSNYYFVIIFVCLYSFQYFEYQTRRNNYWLITHAVTFAEGFRFFFGDRVHTYKSHYRSDDGDTRFYRRFYLSPRSPRSNTTRWRSDEQTKTHEKDKNGKRQRMGKRTVDRRANSPLPRRPSKSWEEYSWESRESGWKEGEKRTNRGEP